jgi:hypothetical protein
MFSSRSARRVSLPVGTFSILLALIGWGLQYKTSLYYHLFQTSPDPPAKLLSDAERPSTGRSALTSDGLASVAGKVQARNASGCVLVAGCDGNPTRDDESFLLVSRVVTSSFYRPRTRFFLRPPPLS